MLRGNKDKFDLIITDVGMPDMDGFKLLELVGLEMDLPVIMLSHNGDMEVVMKGITHGACDYLLKPVRIEQLRNIWQHVIRKKSVPREHDNSNDGTGEVGGSSEHKVSKKRKDHHEEEGDDNEENANENENKSTKKKARFVWSYELNRKFMAAVNHLGVDQAVPKRILALMNVEGITRENVASHLQKYRLFLKKVSSQEAFLAAALGVRDSCLPLASLDSFGDFHTLASSGQLPQNGGHSRNDSTLFGQNIAHGMIRVGHTQHASNSINDHIIFEHTMGSHYENLIQGIPTTLDQLQQHKRMIHEVNNHFPSNFPASGLGAGASNNPTGVITNIPHHSSIGLPSACSGPFEVNARVSSNFSDHVICNKTLQSVLLSSSQANGLAMSSAGSSLNPPLARHSIVDPPSHGQRLNNVMFSEMPVGSMNEQTNYSSLFLPQQRKIDTSIDNGQLRYTDPFSLEGATIQGSLGSNGYCCDELMDVINLRSKQGHISEAGDC